MFRVSPDVIVCAAIGMEYLIDRVAVAAHVVQEWKGVGKVEVHKVYEIFLPRDVYTTREAYR